MTKRDFFKSLFGAAIAAPGLTRSMSGQITHRWHDGRQVYVRYEGPRCYNWKKIQFEELRRGDVFFHAGDVKEAHYEAMSDPQPCDPPGNYWLVVEPITYVEV